MCPRYRLTIHKKHRFLRMRTWHTAVKRPHYRSREDSAPLDRGTGKVKEQLRGSKRAGTCQIQVPAPQRSAVSSIRSAVSWWSPALCPQSL
ncbi:unnamed protein product, partial [Staurois parvus]